MSSNGHGSVLVSELPVPAGRWFGWHAHPDHQLVWASSGVALCRITSGRTWVLPGGLALWVPAGTGHTTGAAATVVLHGIYLDPGRCPVTWSTPTPIAVTGLLRELINHLADTGLSVEARQRAEATLFDQLTPVPAVSVGVPDPTDDRLRRIAGCLRDNPADNRTLAEWGRFVGASSRNLARLFVADTRMTFGQWRLQLRLQAALALLADGMAVSRVAGRVGYATPSAFVAAFRRAVGVSPGAYGGIAPGETAGRSA